MGLILYCALIISTVLLMNSSGCFGKNRSFVIDYDQNCFVKDGKGCFQYISGSVHYFRIPPEYWRDRLMKLRAAGLDAVTTYIMWNYHERERGTFTWDGNADVVRFIEMAHELGLLVIVRPGPYIDNDVDLGGLPWWLLKTQPPIRIRSSDQRFISAAENWLNTILPKIKPLAYGNGGPVISAQVENEYGSYGCDANYTARLADIFKSHLGNDLVLFTTDGAEDGLLRCGSTPGVYPTVDFGVGSYDNTKDAYLLQKKFAPRGPFVVSEFYPGWEDRWGQTHVTTPIGPIIKTIKDIWSLGGSVSIFMFEGGTNFGYWAGSEGNGGGGSSFNPITTSYDYDAPMSEAGDPRKKYYAIRSLIEKLKNKPIPHPVPPPSQVIKYLDVNVTLAGSFLDLLNNITTRGYTQSKYPLTFEDLDLGYGYVLYVVKLKIPGWKMTFESVHDRAYLLINGVPIDSVIQRPNADATVYWEFEKDNILHILVENEGRIATATYANWTDYRAGLTGNVTLAEQIVDDWIMYPLSIENLFNAKDHQRISRIQRSAGDLPIPPFPDFGSSSNARSTNFSNCCPHKKKHIPSVYIGEFDVELFADTYINTSGWGKGIIFINGFNLGRYWPAEGPQVTLYVPKYFLTSPKSTITIFELEKPGNCDYMKKTCRLSFEKQPIWR